MRIHPLVLLALVSVPPLKAQQWNSPESLEVVRQAIARRQVLASDTTLGSYQAVARGLVLFQGQSSVPDAEPPRLIKADQLRVEVYWQAPDRSKQVISAWRDGKYLPTDIRYHRDHLAIVTGGFDDLIQLGEGDEVLGVLHPLAPAGPSSYRYALRDTIEIISQARTLRVVVLDVRPIDPADPLTVGRLYLDRDTGELVRFRFSFTAAAYLDDALEDISVMLENALVDGFWLPYRQEIVIRRRLTWFDFPLRSVIHGRWQIGQYRVNEPLPSTLFSGPAIAGLQTANNRDDDWSEPLDQSVARIASTGGSPEDLATLRSEVTHLVGERALESLRHPRPGANSVSDLARVNRIHGLRLGFGGMLPAGPLDLEAWAGYGISDRRLYLRGSVSLPLGGALVLTTRGYRDLADVGDESVISPLVNSFTSQESGNDHGDYTLLEGAEVGLNGIKALGLDWQVTTGVELAGPVAVAATPSRGSYRVNPGLDSGWVALAGIRAGRAGGSARWDVVLEGGAALEAARRDYLRIKAAYDRRWNIAPGHQLLVRGLMGFATSGVPAYRSFVLGGRGTLPGEPFRAYGGRRALLGHAEWRWGLRVPALGLGDFASTGRTMIVAPFLAVGWSDRELTGSPWRSTPGARPVAGLALEWLMGLVRAEVGVGLRDGGVQLLVDVSRDWWDIL